MLMLFHDFKKCFRQFHELGLRLLNECHNDNEALTRQLLQYDCYLNESAHTLVRPVRTLRIAADIGNEEFVAHSSCQYLLNLEWGGALEFQEDGMFKVKIVSKEYILACKRHFSGYKYLNARELWSTLPTISFWQCTNFQRVTT